MQNLDARVAELAEKYRPIAVRLLKEAIRIPADYVDKPADQGGDPRCGLSNHEGPRLQYLKSQIIELGAVDKPEDVGFDEYGNLVWHVMDEGDGVALADKKVVYYDGHTDTVMALRSQWEQKIGGGIHAYDGVKDWSKVDRGFLRRELGHLPVDDEWDRLVFGRGAADQLGGVCCQVVATKILLELKGEGALKGVIVRSYATAAEEDNDGAGPMFMTQKVWPGAEAGVVPDVVILTEGTGDSAKGALGIYRGQRGRMQIEMVVTGRSCHGSMPWEGLNPMEFGSAIVAEAAAKYDAREGFLDHEFLGHGTRTASWAKLDTPSDCAVPDKLTVRFDRRLTVGESAEQAVADVENLPSVAKARAAGLQVDVYVPRYEELTWTGYQPGNPQIYPGWMTPEDHPAIQTAADVYRRVVAPSVPDGGAKGQLRKEPRIDRWIFSTDGVGFPIPADDTSIDTKGKRWVTSGVVKHPAMFGCGPGIEQNTHKIGECVDDRELQLAVAMLARFPSAYAERG
ncbi:MAG: peptidase dimerization domain-containing protein [Deltaproteobacteria bacterium]|nr:peptidase dimerization domain-containing protein [Deltaproteobacteria bacterium]